MPKTTNSQPTPPASAPTPPAPAAVIVPPAPSKVAVTAASALRELLDASPSDLLGGHPVTPERQGRYIEARKTAEAVLRDGK